MKFYRVVLLSFSLLCTSLSALADTDSVTKDRQFLSAFKASGVIMTSLFPEPQIWINMMPVIGEPRETPSVDVFMTLSNNTSQTITYTFPTSQTFDIYLTDIYGSVVAQWSQGKFFLQVITTLTLEPGDSKTFGGKLELVGLDGQIVNPGDYTLMIKLVNQDNSPGPVTSTTSATISNTNRNPASQMPLRIDWAY